MPSNRQQRRLPATLGFILLFAAVLRVWYLLSYAGLPDWTMLTVDNYYHHHWALDIASGNILGDTTYFRAPLYVFTLALLYTIFGASLWVARLFGLVIGLASVGLSYVLGRRAVSHRVGLIAAALHALWPTALYFEAELLLDPLFLLLLELAVWRMLVWYDSGNVRDALWGGLAIGLAAITRPTALLLVAVAIGVLIFERGHLRPTLRTALALVLGLTVTIGPIFARNLLLARDPVLIASQGGINLYIGNNEAADGVSAVLPEPLGFNWQIRDIVHIAETEIGRSLTPGQVSSYWNNRALAWISENPFPFLRLYAEKLWWNISNREISNNRPLDPFFQRIPLLHYNPLSFGLLFAFALAGIAASLRRNPRLRLLSVILTAFILASALFFFNSRFRLPILPLYFVLAAAGAVILFEALRRRRCLLTPALALIAGALLSCLPLVSLPPGASPQALMAAATHAYADGNFQRALEYSVEAARVDPSYPEVNLNIGNAYLRLGHTDEAQRFYEREARLHPQRPKAYTNLASLAVLKGNFTDALALSQRALALRPYDYDANLIRLRAAFADDSSSSEQLVAETRAAAERTDNDMYLLNEAGILLTHRGLSDHARQILILALEMRPPPIETDDAAFSPNFRHSTERIRAQRARAAYQLGYLAATDGRIDDAVVLSRRAVELDPNLADAWVNLVAGYFALGQLAQAGATLDEALSRFPDRPELLELRRQLRSRQ